MLFILAIYYNAESRNSIKISVYVGFAMAFPISTGVVCLFKQRNIKDKYKFKKSVLMFILAVVMFIGVCLCNMESENNRWYNSQGNGYSYLTDVTFYDENGNVYYPANYVDFNKDGTISYDYKLLHYDALGNAYTYKNIPYFDANGNKYCYSFDSDTLKGSYTNLTTGESFVDEKGYLVYDSKQEFV